MSKTREPLDSLRSLRPGYGAHGSGPDSGFAVVEKQDADEDEAKGPDPGGDAALA